MAKRKREYPLTGAEGIAAAAIRQAVRDARGGDEEAAAWLQEEGAAWVAALLGEPVARAAKAVRDLLKGGEG